MSQISVRGSWKSKAPITYDCPICMTTNTNQLLQLPCGHNLCLSCLHMICAHSSLTCPFCRCRLSTWLRRNPDYSKFIIKQPTSPRKCVKFKVITQKEKPEPKRHYETSKPKPTIDQNGNISEDWLLAQKIHYEQHKEFRYTHGRLTRSMTQKAPTKALLTLFN